MIPFYSLYCQLIQNILKNTKQFSFNFIYSFNLKCDILIETKWQFSTFHIQYIV